MPQVKHTTIYTFAELSDKAKEKARDAGLKDRFSDGWRAVCERHNIKVIAPRSFLTSHNEVITGERLQAACEAVAAQIEASAIKVREEDAFASHVTQAGKDDYIDRFYTQVAAKIRKQENLHNFSVWQRVNTELTGECIAFLP